MKFTILFVIVAVALAAVVGFGIYKNQPETVAFDSLIGVADDLAARDELSPITSMLKNGSLFLGISKAEDENGNSVIGNLGAYGKIYFSENAVALEDIDIHYNDIWVYGDAYLSDEMILVSESKILDGTYGAKRNALALSFENSIFAYGSESKYAIEDTATHNAVVNTLKALEDISFEEDSEELLTKIVPELWQIVCEHCEITQGSAEITLQGKRENARIIRINLDAAALASIVEDIFYYLEQNNDIPLFIRKHEAMLSLSLGLESGQTAYDTYYDFLEVFEENLDDIQDQILDDIKGDIELKIATPMLQSKLLKLEFKNDGDTLLLADFGKDGLRTTNNIIVKLEDQQISYYIEQNDDYAYESTLAVNGYHKMSINVNKSREKFEIQFEELGDLKNVTVKGTYKEGIGWKSLELNKITYSESIYADETVIKCSILAILQETGTLPTITGSHTKLSAITEDEVDAWIEKIKS